MNRLRKGFTLLEVIVTVVLLSILSYYAMTKLESQKFNGQLAKFSNQLVEIVYTGVINPVTGYANGSGGLYCSTGFDYKEISAYRLNLCSDLKFNVVETDATATGRVDGTKSKIIVFSGYTGGLGGLYIDDLTSDTTGETFRMFIDLSALTVSNKRKLYVEDMIISTFEREFSTSLKNIFRQGTGLSTATGGSDGDGMILIEIKK